jgi:hypothetical protein
MSTEKLFEDREAPEEATAADEEETAPEALP